MQTAFKGMALSLLIASAGVPAAAQIGGMVTGNDVDRIMDLARAYGTIERRQDDQGVWLRGEMDGTVYTITFLNCDDAHQNCTSVQFRAWWEATDAYTLEQVNQWNRDRRFSAAYLDNRNNATIEWDVNLAGGVTAENFDDCIQWWQVVLRQFRDEVADPRGNPGTTAPPSGK